jgi:hypothetical protein
VFQREYGGGGGGVNSVIKKFFVILAIPSLRLTNEYVMSYKNISKISTLLCYQCGVSPENRVMKKT